MIPFSQANPPATLAEINQVEQELGFTFPLSYRNFLLDYNGGTPKKTFFLRPIINGSDVQEMHVESLSSISELMEIWNYFTDAMDFGPDELDFSQGILFPIGFNFGGPAICIGINEAATGKIYVVDGDFGVTFQSNTLDAFLESLADDPYADDID